MSRPKKKKKVDPQSQLAAEMPVQNVLVLKKESGLIDLIEKNALSFTLLVCGVIGFLILKDYLQLNKLYLFKDIGSDSINIYYPNYVMTADYIRENGIPQWTNNSGMGQSIFANSVGDIFNDLFYLSGRSNLHYAFAYVEFLKMILGGFIFFSYLRTIKFSKYVSIFGAMIFAFNGYLVLCGSGWPTISTECIIISFLLLAFEKYYSEKKWIYLPLVFGYVAAFQPFFLYIFGLFILLYSIIRIVMRGEYDAKKISLFYLKMGGLAVLGIGIASVFFMNNIWVILQSPRVGGESGYYSLLKSKPMFGSADKIEYISSMCRLFSNDLLGNATQFKGFTNYLESPILYSSLAALLLLPQIFILPEKKNRKIFIAVFMISLIPFIFPYFRYAFWLFSGNYYRSLSLMMITLIILYAVYALQRIYSFGKIHIPTLIGTTVLLLIVLYMSYGTKNQVMNTSLRSTISFFLIIEGIIIYMLSRTSFNDLAKLLLLLVTATELVMMGRITANNRDAITAKEWNEKKGYNDYSVEAARYVQQNDGSFYRISKDYTSNPANFTSFNDAMVQKYNGTMSYNSFNQKYYIEFLQSVNVLKATNENETRWSHGLNNRPLLQTLTTHKYMFTKNPQLNPLGIGYDSVARFGDVRVLKNKFFVPLGVTFNKIIPTNDFKRMSDFQKDVALLKAIVPDSKDMDLFLGYKQIALKDSINPYSFDLYSQDINELRKDTLRITEFKQNKISGTINTDSSKVLLMAMPFDKGWHAFIDGIEQKILIVDNGLMGIMLNAGKHSIEFKYTSVFFMEGLIGTFIFSSLFLFLLIKFRHSGLF